MVPNVFIPDWNTFFVINVHLCVYFYKLHRQFRIDQYGQAIYINIE